MNYRETEHLRVLIANERKDRLALVAPIVVALGHEVIAREIDVEDVGEVTARERPDVALVGLGESSAARARPDRPDRAGSRLPGDRAAPRARSEFIREASKRGVFAHISDADVEDWQSSIDIVLRRFAEYQDLEGAFGRRALIERAKGILMERHAIDDASAFEMLREHSRTDNRKLVDLATAVVDGHRLLPSSRRPGGGTAGLGHGADERADARRHRHRHDAPGDDPGRRAATRRAAQPRAELPEQPECHQRHRTHGSSRRRRCHGHRQQRQRSTRSERQRRRPGGLQWPGQPPAVKAQLVAGMRGQRAARDSVFATSFASFGGRPRAS